MISEFGECKNCIRSNVIIGIRQCNEPWDGRPNRLAKLDFTFALVKTRWYMGTNPPWTASWVSAETTADLVALSLLFSSVISDGMAAPIAWRNSTSQLH
jgi:hypothetical protein